MFWQKLRWKILAYSCEEDGKFEGLDSSAINHVIKA